MITPVLESLFDKVADLIPYNFIKKGLQKRYYPANVAKYLITPILKKICE